MGGVVLFTIFVLNSLCACLPEPDGAVLFSENCASCHLDPLFPRAPHLKMMEGWDPEVIVTALSSGIMEEQGRGLSLVERTAVADYISRGVVAQHP